MRINFVCCCIVLLVFVYSAQAQYVLNVQVVDLQVSVLDKRGQFITDLKTEDFLIWENDVLQEVVDLELQRQPFSIAVLMDTSSSMQSVFQIAQRSTQDFISSLRPEDEFLLMTFDDRIQVRLNFTSKAEASSAEWKDLRYGDQTRMYEALLQALDRLKSAKHPHRALFLISDGVNTAGAGDMTAVIEQAQRYKVIIYTLILENMEADMNALRRLSETTGGTYFILYDEFPRLQAAYEKISIDLANRFTVFYRSSSDYNARNKPAIKIRMKNPDWSVRFQKAYYPS